MVKPTISRRGFSKLMGVGTAYAVVAGSVRRSARTPLPAVAAEASAALVTVVRLSSNENPYGPSPSALKAMTDGFSLAWRYPDEYADMLANGLATVKVFPVDKD